MATRLTPIPRRGFECRLGSDKPQVDLHQYIHPTDSELALLRNGMPTIASTGNTDAGSKGEHWHDFLTEWSEPSPPLDIGIPKIWMEYDNQDSRTHPVPSVFIGSPQEVSPSVETYSRIVVPSLDRLFGSDWHVFKDNLHRCFVHCPEHAFIGNIGIMLSRDSQSLRINVKHLQPDSLISYLQRLGWQGETDELETLMAQLFAFSDLITVCLDIGQKVRSRIGFECAIREQHPPVYHWDVFLDYLVPKGLCEPHKRAALLDWPGYTSPMSAEAVLARSPDRRFSPEAAGPPWRF